MTKNFMEDISIPLLTYYRIKERKINFNEVKHSFDIDGLPFTSVSKFIEQYQDSFDSAKVAYFQAKKHNESNDIINTEHQLNDQYFLDRWKLKAEMATSKGSYIHLFSQSFPYFVKPELTEEFQVIKFFNDLPANMIVVGQELKIFNLKFKYAGIMDLLIYDTHKNRFHLYDWKSNQKLLDDKYVKDNLNYPFNNYKATKLNKYLLQQLHYRYAFEEMFKTNTLELEITKSSKYLFDPYLKTEEASKYLRIDNKSNKMYIHIPFIIDSMSLIWIHQDNEDYKVLPLPNIRLNDFIKK